jgi:DNA-binding cell septation regulator SpoVG
MNKGEWGKLRAFFDLKTNEGFVVKGFKLVEGISGLFVGMPSTQGKDGEYYDTVFADKELRDELQQVAIRTYGQDSVNSSPSPQSAKMPPPESEQSSEPTKNEEFSDDDIPF